jgi:hypothetical protein
LEKEATIGDEIVVNYMLFIVTMLEFYDKVEKEILSTSFSLNTIYPLVSLITDYVYEEVFQIILDTIDSSISSRICYKCQILPRVEYKANGQKKLVCTCEEYGLQDGETFESVERYVEKDCRLDWCQKCECYSVVCLKYVFKETRENISACYHCWCVTKPREPKARYVYCCQAEIETDICTISHECNFCSVEYCTHGFVEKYDLHGMCLMCFRSFTLGTKLINLLEIIVKDKKSVTWDNFIESIKHIM